MMLVGQGIERAVVVRSSKYPELTQLLEKVLSSSATSRLTAQQLAESLRGGGSGLSPISQEIPDNVIVANRADVSSHMSSAPSTRTPAQDVLERFKNYRLSPFDSDKARAEIALFTELKSRGMVSPSEAEEFGNESRRFDFVNILGGQALDAHSQADFDKCIGIATRIIEFEPKVLHGWYLLAIAHQEKGEYDAAIADFTRALELNSEVAIVWAGRGLAYQYKGEFDAAIVDLTRALELDSKDATFWFSRGEAHLMKGKHYATISDPAHVQEGEYDQAIADFTHALELNPNDVSWWTRRAYAHWLKREYDACIVDMTRALELDPKNATFWFSRGEAHMMKGEHYATISDFADRQEDEYDQAIADFTCALEINPNDVSGWTKRASVHWLKREYEATIADLTRAWELDPKNARSLGLRGYAYQTLGDYDKAIEDLSHALDIDPFDGIHWQGRGECNLSNGKYSLAGRDFHEAVECYSKSIEQNPNDADAYNSRAWTLLLLGEEIERALQDADRAVSLNPANRNHYRARGTAFAMKEDYSNALRDFDESVRLEPSAIDYHLRAVVWQRLGDTEGAKSDLAEAKRLDPNIERDVGALILSRPPLRKLVEQQEVK